MVQACKKKKVLKMIGYQYNRDQAEFSVPLTSCNISPFSLVCVMSLIFNETHKYFF